MSVNLNAYPNQDRILGSAAVISIMTPAGPMRWAAVDQFDATSKTKTQDFQPLGMVAPRPQLIYAGYTLTFKGGMIDGTVDQAFYSIDTQLLQGRGTLRVRVTETVYLIDSSQQNWIYPDTALYGFKKSNPKADSDIQYDFSGESPIRYPA